MRYFIKTPWWMKKIYPAYVWDVDTKENILYLTFDDGPHPVATPFVLDELARYNAKATFFCIGKNVVEYPSIYRRILDEGHAVGNHTHNHLNGWKTNDSKYFQDIAEAALHIDSNMFRPPYGRIKTFHAKNMQRVMKKPDARIIMWTVLSGDFDLQVSKEECLQHVILNATKGSIVVFHDSEKAFPKLEYSLPLVLKHFSSAGFRFETLIEKSLEKIEEKTPI
jgi:peptidoglycan/xylan/chitin deacetylase (PgdA/CDA1 family)